MTDIPRPASSHPPLHAPATSFSAHRSKIRGDVFVKCSGVFYLQMFTSSNYISERYIQLSYGSVNRVATCFGKGLPTVLYLLNYFSPSFPLMMKT